MERIVLTSYRKLYRWSRLMDENVAMRSLLWSPTSTLYNVKRRAWEVIHHPENEEYVQELIRRLNGGRRYYIPPTAEELAQLRARTVRASSVLPDTPAATTAAATPRHVAPSYSTIPDAVQPYDSLQKTLRYFFETMPFSLRQMNIAFACVKELSFVVALADPSPIQLQEEEVTQIRREALNICRSLEVRPMGTVTLKGLLRDNQQSVSSSRRHREGSEEEETDIVNKLTDEKVPATPTEVQLLITHPQVRGFFRQSVVLLLEHSDFRSSGIILSKRLVNAEGLPMTVKAAKRFSRVHPIFPKYLSDHCILIGGPLCGNPFDASVRTLHTVPNVPKAQPIAEGLWLGGELDILLEKLDAKIARPEDIVVVCGFSGWGTKQLNEEVAAGTWVVASSAAEDNRVVPFLMKLAKGSKPDEAPPTSAEPSRLIPVFVDEEIPADEGELSKVSLGYLKSGEHGDGLINWEWLRAFATLGEPLSRLSEHQKPDPRYSTVG